MNGTSPRYREGVAAKCVEQEEPAGHRRTHARRVVVIVVWVAATLIGLATAATTRIGPIVLTVSAHHGVHVGDLLAFAAAYSAALAVTLRVLPARAWR